MRQIALFCFNLISIRVWPWWMSPNSTLQYWIRDSRVAVGHLQSLGWNTFAIWRLYWANLLHKRCWPFSHSFPLPFFQRSNKWTDWIRQRQRKWAWLWCWNQTYALAAERRRWSRKNGLHSNILCSHFEWFRWFRFHLPRLNRKRHTQDKLCCRPSNTWSLDCKYPRSSETNCKKERIWWFLQNFHLKRCSTFAAITESFSTYSLIEIWNRIKSHREALSYACWCSEYSIRLANSRWCRQIEMKNNRSALFESR